MKSIGFGNKMYTGFVWAKVRNHGQHRFSWLGSWDGEMGRTGEAKLFACFYWSTLRFRCFLDFHVVTHCQGEL